MTGPWQVVVVMLACTVLVIAVLVLGLLRRFSTSLEYVEMAAQRGGAGIEPAGLPPGTRISAFTGRDADGHTQTLADLLDGQLTIFLLAEPGCPPCENIIAQLAAEPWSEPAARLVIATSDTEHMRRRRLEGLVSAVVYQQNNDVTTAFGASVTPTSFLVSSEGAIVSWLVPKDLPALRKLAAHQINVKHPSQQLTRAE